MKKQYFTTGRITFAALLAAVYAAVTVLTASFAYGPIQFRIAEALAVFCCFTPAAVWGMTVGCIAANMLSIISVWDMLIGASATLLACVITRKIKNVWLVPLPTILCNAVIVGAEIAFFFDERAFLPAFGLNALSVGAGEAAVMYLLGVPLLLLLRKNAAAQRSLARL